MAQDTDREHAEGQRRNRCTNSSSCIVQNKVLSHETANDWRCNYKCDICKCELADEFAVDAGEVQAFVA